MKTTISCLALGALLFATSATAQLATSNENNPIASDSPVGNASVSSQTGLEEMRQDTDRYVEREFEKRRIISEINAASEQTGVVGTPGEIAAFEPGSAGGAIEVAPTDELQSGMSVISSDGVDLGAVAFVERSDDGSATTVNVQDFAGDEAGELFSIPASSISVEDGVATTTMASSDF